VAVFIVSEPTLHEYVRFVHSSTDSSPKARYIELVLIHPSGRLDHHPNLNHATVHQRQPMISAQIVTTG
jgi:hypothetical protein